MNKLIIATLMTSLGLAPLAIHAEELSLSQLQQQQLNQLQAQLDQADTTSNSLDKIIFHRLIEIESAQTQSYNSNDSSESHTESHIALATFELAMEASLNPYTSTSVTLLYEQNDTPLEVDTATIVFANIEKTPLSLTLGQAYLPFGAFETSQVNDTLALEIAETRNTLAMLGFSQSGISANLYWFNNEDSSNLNQLGAHLGYDNEYFCLGADYIDNAFVADKPATSLHACGHIGALTLTAEYLQLDTFETEQNKLDVSATQAEAAYEFSDITLALAYQKTHDCLHLELPEQRVSLAAAINLYNNTQVAVEYWHDNDYAKAEGGSGGDSDNLVMQVAVAF